MQLAHLIDPPDREQDRMRDEDHEAVRRFLEAARRCAVPTGEAPRPARAANGPTRR